MRDARAAMSQLYFGTTAFAFEVMRANVGIGAPLLIRAHVVDFIIVSRSGDFFSFAPWLPGLVPKRDRDKVREVIDVVVPRFEGEKATDEMIDTLCAEVLHEVYARVEPVLTTDEDDRL